MKKYFLILAIIILLCLGFVILISYIGIPKAPKPTLQEQLAAVDVDLKILELTLGDYFSDYNTFPDTLLSLTTPLIFIETLPADPFNLHRHPVAKGENPYTYLKYGVGKRVAATLCSYGPDNDDDTASLVYDPTNGTISDGDIVRHISAPADNALMGTPRRSYVYENRQLARAADDNGIKDFMLASKKFRYDSNDPKDSDAVEAATSVMQEGWQGDLGVLESLIEKNQPALTLIHEGAKKPYARSIIVENEFGFPHDIPDLFPINILAKLSICEGKKFEAGGHGKNAICSYIDTAKLGQSIGNGLLISKLFDDALEKNAYKQIQKVLLNSQFDATYLESLVEELEKLERSSPPISVAFWHENLPTVNIIQQACDVKKLARTNPMWQALLCPVAYTLVGKRTVRNSTKLWTEAIAYAKKPYPEAITFDADAIVKQIHPLTKMLKPDYIPHAITRDTTTKAHSRLTRIMAALELFRSRNNAYPDTLDDLGDILKPIPLDPFTEKNFEYGKVGDAYRLYSTGPDMRDDFAAIIYDPTNGTESPGDIIFRD
jgi:hypothetical protein